MRVLQINALGKTLSTGRTTREMHEALLEKGHESFIATACNKDCDDAYAISSMNLMHIDVILSIITGLELYHSRFQTKKFLAYMASLKPDIVHLRVLHNSFINLGMLLQYLATEDIATVITLHDLWFITGKCPYFLKYQCNKWQKGCNYCPALKDEAHPSWFDRTQKMWNDKKKWLNGIPRLAVVGNSDWTTEQAKKSFLDSSKIITRIYNWIDLDIFYPRETEKLRHNLALENKFIILSVATKWKIHNRKGFDDFLKLAEVLPQEFQILLVGDLEYNHPLPPNITSLSLTNNLNLLAEYYSMADVYLNLSVEETFGKVSAEAASCGTPVIALDACANKEIVPRGASVILKNTNPHEILLALKEIRKEEKKKYLKVCRSHAEYYFSKEKNIMQYLRLYEELNWVRKS